MTQRARTAQSENEQIVSKVLASLKATCGRITSQPVMAWEVQALHLALRRDYHRADYTIIGTRANGDTLISVRSDSQPGTRYSVTVHPLTHPTCDCLAGAHGRPCKHAGMALGAVAEEHERARRDAQDEWASLTRAERREMAAIAIRYYQSRERAGR